MSAKYIMGLAAITDWHDGDTPHGVIDLGDGLAWGAGVQIVHGPTGNAQVVLRPQRFRIAGLKAPELKAEGGPEARQRAMDLVPWGVWPIRRYGFDKYRRPLIDIELAGVLFSQAMVELGAARSLPIASQLLEGP